MGMISRAQKFTAKLISCQIDFILHHKKLILKYVLLVCLLVGIAIHCEAAPHEFPKQESKFIQDSDSQNSLSELFDLPFQELMKRKVSTASFVERDQLIAEAATSVVHRKEWEKQGSKQTFDALQYLPGMQVYPYLGGTQAVAIRGYTNLNTNRRTAILIDGIPLNLYVLPTGSYGAPFDLGVLEKIEVLRGAGSPVYGNDAFFGVIQMFSEAPVEDKASAEARFGSFDYLGANVRVSHELSKNMRLTLLTGLSGQTPNLQSIYRANEQNYSLNEKRNFNYWTNIGKLNFWKDAELELLYGYYNGEGWPPSEVTALPVKNTTTTESKLLASKFANTWEPFSWADLKTKSYFWTQRLRVLGVNEFGDVTTIVPFDERRAGTTIFLKSPALNDLPFNWLVGYSIDYWEDPELTQSLYPGGPFPPGETTTLHTTRSINAVLLDSDTQIIPQKLTLLFGARYDVISTGQSHFSPRGGLVFQPDVDTSFKLLFGNAFRSPTFRELSNSLLIRSNPDLKPETIDSLELNFLTRGKAENLFLSVFYSNWRNAIVSGVFNAPDRTLIMFNNTGKGISYGFEYDLKYQPSALGYFINGAYVRSADITQGRLDYSAYPMLNLNWGLNYHLSTSGLSFSFLNRNNWFWTDNVVPSTSVPLKSYFRTDFSIQWDLKKDFPLPGKYGLSFNIRNLFNRENYIPTLTSFGGGFKEEGINFYLALNGQAS
jgi:outer membrane receptor protein involved in Fe transport